jgi:hypothetical protein
MTRPRDPDANAGWPPSAPPDVAWVGYLLLLLGGLVVGGGLWLLVWLFRRVAR